MTKEKKTNWFLVMLVMIGVIGGVFIVGAGIFLNIKVYTTYKEHKILDDNSGYMTAVIIDESSHINNKSSSYYLSYSFMIDGNTYTKEQEVSKEIFLKNPIGSELSIKYSKDNPNISNFLGNEEVFFEQFIIAIIFDIIIFFF